MHQSVRKDTTTMYFIPAGSLIDATRRRVTSITTPSYQHGIAAIIRGRLIQTNACYFSSLTNFCLTWNWDRHVKRCIKLTYFQCFPIIQYLAVWKSCFEKLIESKLMGSQFSDLYGCVGKKKFFSIILMLRLM